MAAKKKETTFNFNQPVFSYSSNDIYKTISDHTNQIATYFEQNFSGLTMARPTYPKQLLLDSLAKSATNMRCILTKAHTIAGIGYGFEDEENAEKTGVKNFAENLIDRTGNPISLSKLLTLFVADSEFFGESYFELARIAGKLQNMLLLSAKNCYTDIDRTKIVQIILSGRNINKRVVFKPYTKYTPTERDVLYISKQSPLDDVYGVPNYISALSAIESNHKIGLTNLAALENTVDPSLILFLFGNLSVDLYKSVKDAFQKVKRSKGTGVVLNLPENIRTQLENYGSKTIDGNYINERAKNELEIMALHGITPELYGTIQSGGISSGEKATGALKLFLQTVVRPEQENLSKILEAFFKIEFPGYDAGFKFKEIDLTDSLEDEQLQQTRSAIHQTYINIGSLELLNEYRRSVGLIEVSQAEFDKIKANGLPDFNISQPARF